MSEAKHVRSINLKLTGAEHAALSYHSSLIGCKPTDLLRRIVDAWAAANPVGSPVTGAPAVPQS